MLGPRKRLDIDISDLPKIGINAPLATIFESELNTSVFKSELVWKNWLDSACEPQPTGELCFLRVFLKKNRFFVFFESFFIVSGRFFFLRFCAVFFCDQSFFGI
jgi:hypothetical protein